jgi:hypothetical protein
LIWRLALELERAGGQLVVPRLQEEGVEPATVVDGAERIGRNPHPDRAAERIRHHGDVDQVGEKPPLGLAVGMAHLVSDLPGLAGQFTAP